MGKVFCEHCGLNIKYETYKHYISTTIRGIPISAIEEEALCSECGCRVYVPEIHDANIDRIAEAYKNATSKDIDMDSRILYPAIFHLEKIGYSASVPDFDKVNFGCYSQGDTFTEALRNITDALGLAITHILESGKELPTPTSSDNIEISIGDYLIPLEVWFDKS